MFVKLRFGYNSPWVKHDKIYEVVHFKEEPTDTGYQLIYRLYGIDDMFFGPIMFDQVHLTPAEEALWHLLK